MMGWTFIIRIGEIFRNLSSAGSFYFSAGGLSYTFGAIVYATKRPRLMEGFFGFHELWHIMVMIGAVFHYLMILTFYLPS